MPLEIVFLEPQNWRPLKPITKALLPPSRFSTVRNTVIARTFFCLMSCFH